MNLIISKWESEQCPGDDGIFLADDTYWPLTESGAVGEKQPVPAEIDFHVICVDDPLTENAQIHVFGGETSWEGAGYLALVTKPSGAIEWLIHALWSEPFQEAHIEHDCIVATSYEYPFSWLWRIPILAPQKLSVSGSKVN